MEIVRRLIRGKTAGLKFGGASGTAAATGIGLVAASGVALPIAVITTMVGGSAIAVGAAAAYITGRSFLLPDGLLLEPGTDVQYVATYCTQKTLAEADELTRPYYRNQFVPPNVAEQWRVRNPQGFVHIVNANGDLCAAFGIIGLEHTFLSQFLKGRVSDTQMESSDVLSFEDSKRARWLYISGVVVREPHSMLGHRRAVVMFWAMLQYIRALYGTRKQRVAVALAVSNESTNFLRNCGFKIRCIARDRTDKVDLYELDITRERIDAIAQRLGDQSAICTCEW